MPNERHGGSNQFRHLFPPPNPATTLAATYSSIFSFLAAEISSIRPGVFGGFTKSTV
jgi:hypothetical protein